MAKCESTNQQTSHCGKASPLKHFWTTVLRSHLFNLPPRTMFEGSCWLHQKQLANSLTYNNALLIISRTSAAGETMILSRRTPLMYVLRWNHLVSRISSKERHPRFQKSRKVSSVLTCALRNYESNRWLESISRNAVCFQVWRKLWYKLPCLLVQELLAAHIVCINCLLNCCVHWAQVYGKSWSVQTQDAIDTVVIVIINFLHHGSIETCTNFHSSNFN